MMRDPYNELIYKVMQNEWEEEKLREHLDRNFHDILGRRDSMADHLEVFEEELKYRKQKLHDQVIPEAYHKAELRAWRIIAIWSGVFFFWVTIGFLVALQMKSDTLSESVTTGLAIMFAIGIAIFGVGNIFLGKNRDGIVEQAALREIEAARQKVQRLAANVVVLRDFLEDPEQFRPRNILGRDH